MPIKFRLRGNVSDAIRSDDEMSSVDKKAADKSFRDKKKKLDLFLQQKGFAKYKTNAYARRNNLNVLEYINLQKEQYGSKTFTVNYALIALYVPHSFLSYDLGGRLGRLICDRDVWWDYSNAEIAEISFQNVMDAIDDFLLPWFEERKSKESLKRELLKEEQKRKKYGGRLSDIQQAWLNVIDSEDDYSDIISNNIVTFKLPG
jgi:hypothetical protein